MKRTLSLILALILCLSMSVFMISCEEELPTPEPDESTDDTAPKTDENTDTDDTVATGVGEQAWEKMISEETLQNYTVTMSGTMTVTQTGVEPTVSNVKEITKITATQIEMTPFEVAEDGTETAGEPMVLDGEMAQMQKEQAAWLFTVLLEDYDNFEFDAKTNTYLIPEEITLQETIAGMDFDPEGNPIPLDIPTTIVMKDGEVTLSEDGKLVKFVCDYTQSMTMAGQNITTSGATTWVFSDYGTTQIG